MKIKNDVKVVLSQSPLTGYLAYIEQMPEITASGNSFAEANQNLLFKLKRFENEMYSTFNITEYKYESSSYLK